MICPECGNPMPVKEVADVRINECPQCKGVWFDQGELDDLKDEIDPDIRWMDFDLWKKRGEVHVDPEAPECPRCRQGRLATLYFEDIGLKIHSCFACRGTWLRAADFLKIVTALSREAERKSVVDYIQLSLKEASDILTHPGSLVSEWKDLKAVLRMLNYRFFIENPKIKDFFEGLHKSLPV